MFQVPYLDPNVERDVEEWPTSNDGTSEPTFYERLEYKDTGASSTTVIVPNLPALFREQGLPAFLLINVQCFEHTQLRFFIPALVWNIVSHIFDTLTVTATFYEVRVDDVPQPPRGIWFQRRGLGIAASVSALRINELAHLLPPDGGLFELLIRSEVIGTEGDAELAMSKIKGILWDQKLRRLESITFPRHVLDNDILAMLSFMDCLKVLEVVDTSLTFNPPVITHRGQLFGLQQLKVDGRVEDAAKIITGCLHSPGMGGKLTRLLINAPFLERRTDIGTLSSSLRSLDCLLDFEMNVRSVHPLEDETWLHIAPLAVKRQGWVNPLQRFVFSHPRPLPLSNNRLKALVNVWTNIQDLQLNPRPTLPPLNLDSLNQLGLGALDVVGGLNLPSLGLSLNTLAERSNRTRYRMPPNAALKSFVCHGIRDKPDARQVVESHFPNANIDFL